MIDPSVARWRDSDFLMDRMIELSRNGSMPEGYLEAYQAYLTRMGMFQRSDLRPGAVGANSVDRAG